MLRNYLIIAWRSLLRNKLYSAINVLGLSIGVSACLVIFLIVNFEFSFDTFHPGGDRIYRVYSRFSGDYDGLNHGVSCGIPASVKNELSGIESQVAFHTYSAEVKIESGQQQPKVFEEQNQIIIAEPDFFKVFSSYEWVAGSPSVSMEKPFQVVLTESKARIYFGEGNPQDYLGREIIYRDSLRTTVSGIVKDLKGNTDFDFTDFISFSTINDSWLKKNIPLEDWESTNSSSQFFVKLEPGTTPQQIEEGLLKLRDVHRKKDPRFNWNVKYPLQPLSDFHYNTEIGIFDNSRSAANVITLKILIGVAVLLLVIASINFINLETAQAMRRAREVGLRKVLGSSRARLVFHFLMQSAVLTFFAVLISLPLAGLALRVFTDFIPKGVHLVLTDPFTIAFLLGSICVVSFLAGFYPAFSLSSFLPVQALKNQSRGHNTHGGLVRKSLIIFQFTFAQVLIVAALVATGQISYMLSKDLGFSKEAILFVDTPWWGESRKVQILKNELTQIPEIEQFTLCDDMPSSQSSSSSTMIFNNGKEELHHNVYRKFGDTSYLQVFKLKLLAGRNVQKSDSVKEFVINETYAKMLGFQDPEDALGKEVTMSSNKYPIVGVVRDFHTFSLRDAIEPVVIADNGNHFSCFGIKVSKINGPEFQRFAEKLESAWKKVYPDQKLEYQFLDKSIAKFYQSEQRTKKLINTATAIAILISCLGLFGLASFTAAQRTKEIGIRKVLGATVQNIVALLSREFLWLVLLAFIVAGPLAYFVADQWLDHFAYRMPIGWQYYAWTILASLFIAVVSVSYQSLRAAMADPVESLRYE